MLRRRVAGLASGVGCGNLGLIDPELGLSGKRVGPSLGYFKHRGRLYDIRDLMDPEYRATSDDEFVRSFDPEILTADWAGL